MTDGDLPSELSSLADALARTHRGDKTRTLDYLSQLVRRWHLFSGERQVQWQDLCHYRDHYNIGRMGIWHTTIRTTIAPYTVVVVKTFFSPILLNGMFQVFTSSYEHAPVCVVIFFCEKLRDDGE